MNLKLNDRGPKVARVQRFLNGRLKKKDRIEVNGVFCPSTRDLVIKLQQKHKLKETGEVDQKTWVALGIPFAEKVAAVFSSAHAKRIDFHLGTIHVSPQRLQDVGAAIAAGRITVEVKSGGKKLSAAYTPHLNRMTIGRQDFESSVVARSGILHEGVHALVDLFHVKTTVHNDEVLAYLAEVIFLQSAGGRPAGDAAAMRIYDEARALAKAKGLYQKKGVNLTAQDVEPLRQAIHANPAYEDIDAETETSGLGVP